MMPKVNSSSRRSTDRGFGILEHGAVVVGILVGLAVVGGMIWQLWGKKDDAVEVSNISTITTNVQGNMKSRNGYDFTSGASMTGILIQRGLAPKSMKIVGDPTSGTATLLNTWGGPVVIAPVATSGFNNGFSTSYSNVPQTACANMVSQLWSGGGYSSVSINSSEHSDSNLSQETVGQECLADSGGKGINTLLFTVNG